MQPLLTTGNANNRQKNQSGVPMTEKPVLNIQKRTIEIRKNYVFIGKSLQNNRESHNTSKS